MVDRWRERGGDCVTVRHCRQVTGFACADRQFSAAGVGLRAVEAFDPHSALVVVDVQNDFADPAGSLAVRGGADIVPLVNEAVAAADGAGAFVAYTQDWHPSHTPHFAPDGGIWPVHCVAG